MSEQTAAAAHDVIFCVYQSILTAFTFQESYHYVEQQFISKMVSTFKMLGFKSRIKIKKRDKKHSVKVIVKYLRDHFKFLWLTLSLRFKESTHNERLPTVHLSHTF